MTERKTVVKVDVHDDKGKRMALKAVTSLSGINSISMDMTEKKMTVIGVVDPCDVVEKLKKHWHPEIVTVGPKDEPKKPDPPNKVEVKDPYVIPPPVHWEEDPNACVIC